MLILPSWLSAAFFPIKSSSVNSRRPKSTLRSAPCTDFWLACWWTLWLQSPQQGREWVDAVQPWVHTCLQCSHLTGLLRALWTVYNGSPGIISQLCSQGTEHTVTGMKKLKTLKTPEVRESVKSSGCHCRPEFTQGRCWEVPMWNFPCRSHSGICSPQFEGTISTASAWMCHGGEEKWGCWVEGLLEQCGALPWGSSVSLLE